MKQVILIISIIAAFLCGQTSAGATVVPVSKSFSFAKSFEKASALKLVGKIIPSGKEAQYPSFSKKRRLNKCYHQEFIICHFSEIRLAAQQQGTVPQPLIRADFLSVFFLPNGKRGPPALA